MKKRITLLIFTIMLFGTASVGQISEVEYSKLVDYVNCYYTEKYISLNLTIIKKVEDNKSFTKYQKAFKERVISYSDISLGFDKTMPNSTSIFDAFKKFAGHYPKFEDLWIYINNKKNSYKNDWTKEQMIEALIYLPTDKSGNKNNDYKSSLNNAPELLRSDLETKVSYTLFQTQDTGSKTSQDKQKKAKKGRIQDTTKKNANGETKSCTNCHHSSNTEKGNPRKFLSFLFWLCIIGIAAFAFVFRFRTKIKSFSEHLLKSINPKITAAPTPDTSNNQKELKILQHEILRLKDFETDNAKLRNDNKRLENEIRALKQQIVNLQESLSSKSKSDTVSDLPSPTNKPQTYYADAIVGDKFNKVVPIPNEESIYELLLNRQSATTAEFTLYEGNKKQVLRNADKVDGCDKTGTNAGATTIQVEKGETMLDDFGKWKITKKAKIKFI
jgi:hypothetical protein